MQTTRGRLDVSWDKSALMGWNTILLYVPMDHILEYEQRAAGLVEQTCICRLRAEAMPVFSFLLIISVGSVTWCFCAFETHAKPNMTSPDKRLGLDRGAQRCHCSIRCTCIRWKKNKKSLRGAFVCLDLVPFSEDLLMGCRIGVRFDTEHVEAQPCIKSWQATLTTSPPTSTRPPTPALLCHFKGAGSGTYSFDVKFTETETFKSSALTGESLKVSPSPAPSLPKPQWGVAMEEGNPLWIVGLF